VIPFVAELQRIEPISSERPYASRPQAPGKHVGPTSPRQEPTVVRRFESPTSVGNQSTSHQDGRGGVLDHVVRCT